MLRFDVGGTAEARVGGEEAGAAALVVGEVEQHARGLPVTPSASARDHGDTGPRGRAGALTCVEHPCGVTTDGDRSRRSKPPKQVDDQMVRRLVGAGTPRRSASGATTTRLGTGRPTAGS